MPARIISLTYKTAFLLLVLSVAVVAQQGTAPQLTVVYPEEGDVVQAGDSTYVFGHVTPPGVPVFVNGVRAKKYVNGTFMAVVPVTPGVFRFSCLAIDGLDSTRVLRSVRIPDYLFETPPEPARFDTSLFFPAAEYELFPGEHAAFFAKTARGKKPFVHIPELGISRALHEMSSRRRRRSMRKAVFAGDRLPFLPKVRGVYGTTLPVPATSPFDSTLTVMFTLSSDPADSVRLMPPARLRVLNPAREYWGRIDSEVRSGLPGRKRGQILIIPQGALVRKKARDGNSLHVSVSAKSRFWIPATAFSPLDSLEPPKPATAVLARSESEPDLVRLRIFLQRRLAVTVLQTRRPQQLRLRLYGTAELPDMLRQDFSDPILHEIRGRRMAEDEYEYTIRLNMKQQWGYRVYYDNTDLILEIRKPPVQRFNPELPFEGLLICLDPGHSPDEGATGPTGSSEKAVTPGYTRLLKKLLEEKGATVMVTRNDTAGVTLAARTLIADAAGAHLFISMHFNSLPDGINPFPLRGSGVYYYTSQSYLPATYVNDYLRKITPLPNYGVTYQSLYVCRQTAMPAILLEPAFIMHPLEEMYILNGEYRRRVAEAVVKGLEAFLRRAL